jgi:ribosomal protein L10
MATDGDLRTCVARVLNRVELLLQDLDELRDKLTTEIAECRVSKNEVRLRAFQNVSNTVTRAQEALRSLYIQLGLLSLE